MTPLFKSLYLRYDDFVQITEEAGLLSKDVVWWCGIGYSQSSGQGWVCTEWQGEVILPQEREQRSRVTREELQSHRSTWKIQRYCTDVGVFLGDLEAIMCLFSSSPLFLCTASITFPYEPSPSSFRTLKCSDVSIEFRDWAVRWHISSKSFAAAWTNKHKVL